MSRTRNRLTEIARIGKVHGLDGTVRFHLKDEHEPLIELNSILYLQNRRGDFIPARVMDIRVEKKRNKRLFFVKFDRIADRSEAEQFLERPVYAKPELIKPDLESSMHNITGFEIVDNSGLVGIVSGVMENPAHPIIEAEIVKRHKKEMLLIPWVDEYVNSIDTEHEIVLCHNLDQLMNH